MKSTRVPLTPVFVGLPLFTFAFVILAAITHLVYAGDADGKEEWRQLSAKYLYLSPEAFISASAFANELEKQGKGKVLAFEVSPAFRKGREKTQIADIAKDYGKSSKIEKGFFEKRRLNAPGMFGGDFIALVRGEHVRVDGGNVYEDEAPLKSGRAVERHYWGPVYLIVDPKEASVIACGVDFVAYEKHSPKGAKSQQAQNHEAEPCAAANGGGPSRLPSACPRDLRR